MKIETNSVVSIHYTLKAEDGQILDSSEGKDPLAFIQGIGQLIPGLEKQLEGQEAGNHIDAEIAPADGYGEYNQDMVLQVDKEGFRGTEELTVGLQVEVELDDGKSIAEVTKIDGDNVTLDLNHPLAGMKLFFSVDIVDVRTATQEELDHGHAHGVGGHHH